jgi:hypothetical protein
MYIPRQKLHRWAAEVIQQCTADLEIRIQRGALYRNMYLTGDENGTPRTYPKSYAHIATLAAMLFSPMELNFAIKFPAGSNNQTLKAIGRVATSELHEEMADAGVYDVIRDAVKWALVKGKSFVKLNWEDEGFAPYMVQPEFMGVLRPDIKELSRQPAFTHSTYYTPSQFAHAFRDLENIRELMREIGKRGARGLPDQRPDRANVLKQIVLGGLNPFQQAGSSPAAASSRGIVDWLGGPTATWDAKVMAQLIRLDELWVKDSVTDDWATFHLVGDVMVTGDKQIRNAFSTMYDPANPLRRLPEAFRENNPLDRMHPFVQFSPTDLDGYFWGRSELCNIGSLQMQLNARLDGINRLLRRQEKPPVAFTGTTAMNRDRYSNMDMPGGLFVDPSPNTKMQKLYPELPEGLWESLHEIIEMYDDMSGMPPVMRGRGEAGVRAQGHAQTLTQNASPRFKELALSVERSVAELGMLGLSLLRAMNNDTMIAWLPPETQNVVATMEPDEPELEPPAPGMKQVPFRWAHIPQKAKIRVATHSSSPIFGMEGRALLFDLAKLHAVDAEDLVEQTHPPGEEEILDSLERKKIAEAKLLAEHPELLQHMAGPGKKK